MASILKTLAFAAGTGVVVGICTATANRRTTVRQRGLRAEPRREPNPQPQKDILDIEPLLDRLEVLERRFATAEPFQASTHASVDVSELTSRIDAQESEIERLRMLVDVRVNEIEQRLAAEMRDHQTQALAMIEKTVELKISERIAAIERTLAEQSSSIDLLRERAQETDVNLKRLISAIERLCERTQPLHTGGVTVTTVPVPPPAPGPGPNVVPFDAHMAEARQKQEEGLPDFSPKLFVEEGKEPRKPRFPLTRLFGMLALIVLSQVLSH